MAKLPTGKKVVWQPQPRQSKFLRCPADERFFGGAKGGGKTDALLGDYLRQLVYARDLGVESSGVLFRRSYRELEGVIKRSHQVYPKLGGEFKIARGTWNFPGYGELQMRFIDRDSDAEKYQGIPYDWIGVDELGLYGSPFVWNQLTSCNRSADGVPTRMAGSGNPGGAGQGWIKRRWISGKQPDRIYTYDQTWILDGVEDSHRVTRCFIPSKVNDNKYWKENDPGYIAKLAALPEHQRKAYLDGDWDVNIGQAFGQLGPPHYVEPFSIPMSWTRFATFDWGVAKPYSLGIWAISPVGRLYRIAEKYGCVKGMEDEGVKEDAKTAGRKIVPVLNAMGVSKVYADPAIWQRHGHGRTIAELLQDVGMNVIPGDRDRAASKATFETLLSSRLDDGAPAFQVFTTCHDWLRTVPNLVSDKKNIEDVDTNGEDHAYDDTRFAVMSPEATHGVVRSQLPVYRKNSYVKEGVDHAR